jgi:hypothetical protein
MIFSLIIANERPIMLIAHWGFLVMKKHTFRVTVEGLANTRVRLDSLVRSRTKQILVVALVFREIVTEASWAICLGDLKLLVILYVWTLIFWLLLVFS